ncbi:hypothetical protein Tco_1016868 [Tanacetum coccineum]|uniref:PB1-like domain-containing protein n=1 Tax=Tanacetum coccineum TaxID=301880 RepID=A0ABQ5FR85_9ASTR
MIGRTRRNSYKCDEIVVDVFYNGCFVIYPLKYGGQALELKLSKVNKLSFKEMGDLLLEKVNEDIWHWFYKKPDCSLEDGLTIVENDRDVSKLYEMAELHGYLEVYVAHFPQYLVTDYYLKNLFVDKNDAEVTSLLRSHEKIKKDLPGDTIKEMIDWEIKEQSSPSYLISPNSIKPKVFPNDLKGKSLLYEFDEKAGDGSRSSSSKWIEGKSLIVDFENVGGEVEGEGEGEGEGEAEDVGDERL